MGDKMVKTHRREPEEFVKGWYGQSAEFEWERLQRDPYHRIEHMVTVHFLQKFLSKRGVILDARGGPGRYTIELARQGYSVVLLERALSDARITI
jgi:hypothetical protein